jgi:hypothetical protein
MPTTCRVSSARSARGMGTYEIGDREGDLSESKRSLEMPRFLHLGDDGEHGRDTTIGKDERPDSSDCRVERWVLE